MLLNITIENWMSFKEKTSFSMIAGLERQHRDRTTSLKKYKTRVLPIAALYGGNASGKTNFFKAFSFLRRFIVSGPRSEGVILVEPYLLDDKSVEGPTRFSIEILIDEIIYEYSIAITKTHVIEEKLVRITSASEKNYFIELVMNIIFINLFKATRHFFMLLRELGKINYS